MIHIILSFAMNLQVKVSIYNYQLYRHIEAPGWKLSWSWKGDEVIWYIGGAEATEQGDCSRIRAATLPHTCEKKPVIIDLMPGALYNKQVANCCRGGVLTSTTQDSSNYLSAFQMNVGGISIDINKTDELMPANFSIGVPGYTCSDPFQVDPTRFLQPGTRRYIQAFRTWNVSCTYSQFRASPSPTCCVLLSAFYNENIVPCPLCSCGCRDLPGTKCVSQDETPPLLELPHSDLEAPTPMVRCSRHMCPIRVHWHIKRVKITVTNLNFAKNYSDWNLVVQHPNMKSVTQVFSFNYVPLDQYGHINESGVFFGIQSFNDLLLQSGETGNVQTEMLLHKDAGIFTFREGWGFPRKISFNGDECVMPPPDEYPRLPNGGLRFKSRPWMGFFSSLLLVLMI
ncbi:COBRA, plant [Dillenia turbinata]|uniref:COBRA, plant n=1 Tax=Dillenia turbinata TaxID=194707 RepID=A0AAN8ZL70_9MAGN